VRRVVNFDGVCAGHCGMRAARVGLRDGVRPRLESWSRSSKIRAGLAQRAHIVLLAADGLSNTEIAEKVGVSRPTVISWRRRYETSGMAGLSDQVRSGRPRRVDIVGSWRRRCVRHRKSSG
jgi:hypothetical protein